MPSNKANLLLHPVRLRIVTALTGQPLTTAAIQALLPDIPQASLYRQIKLLLDGEMLEVYAENKVNGAIERSYRLRDGQGRLTAEDVQGMSREEHLQFYNIFVASLLEAAGSYLETADLSRIFEDGFSYNRVTIHLSPEEKEGFRQEIGELLMRYISKPPSPERQSYTLASTVIPQQKDNS